MLEIIFPNLLFPAIQPEKFLLSHNTLELFPVAIYFVRPKPVDLNPHWSSAHLLPSPQAVLWHSPLASTEFQTASLPGHEERVKLRESPRY